MGSIAELDGIDQVEFLAEAVGVDRRGEVGGVDADLAGAGGEGRQLEEIVAEPLDVKAGTGGRAGRACRGDRCG
ncbi:MAG: hypothetical protein ACHQ50_12825 [Fimbriimonadales bacterium]